jgi:hypothetical protein
MPNSAYRNVALLFLGAACIFPFSTHAEMSSTNFTLETDTIGHVGTVMTSTNFSLTPSQGTSFIIATPVVVDDSDDTESGKKSGSKKHEVTTIIPKETEFITATVNEKVPFQNIEFTQNTVFETNPLDTEERAGVIEKVAQEGDKKADIPDTARTEKKFKSQLLASLATGEWKEFWIAFKQLFEQKTVRFIVLLVVLLILFSFKKYTYIGKRYLPFW